MAAVMNKVEGKQNVGYQFNKTDLYSNLVILKFI